MARGRTSRTPKNRETIIAALREGLSVGGACAVAGMARNTYYDWRKADPEFAAEADEAIENGTDFLEDVARQRATDSSDTLLIFLLKARRPEKYRERAETRHVGDEEQPVSITLVRGS